jgi:hypothetical protein
MKYDKEKIIELLREGKSSSDIAKIFNVNTQVIQRTIRKIELPDDIYIKYRPSKLTLTQTELDVLIGGLLGDSWLGYTKKGKNACGSFTHKLEHSEYVDYKYNLLKRLCSKPTIHNKIDKRSNRFYQQYFCKIGTNPVLNDIVNKFYVNNKKVVSKEYLDKLSPLALAIWFMDDGSKTQYSYKISTNCFDIKDLIVLKNWLLTFNIECSFNSENEILIAARSKKIFTKLIKEFFPKCMTYKLHNLSSLNSVKRGNSLVKRTIPC